MWICDQITNPPVSKFCYFRYGAESGTDLALRNIILSEDILGSNDMKISLLYQVRTRIPNFRTTKPSEWDWSRVELDIEVRMVNDEQVQKKCLSRKKVSFINTLLPVLETKLFYLTLIFKKPSLTYLFSIVHQITCFLPLSSFFKQLCNSNDGILNHANYFRIGGKFNNKKRPVLILGLTRWFFQNGVLPTLISKIRAKTKENCYNGELAIIGDQVWKNAPIVTSHDAIDDDIYEPFDLLDAVINIDISSNIGRNGYVGGNVVESFYKDQREWRNAAWRSDCGYIPSIVPGEPLYIIGCLSQIFQRIPVHFK